MGRRDSFLLKQSANLQYCPYIAYPLILHKSSLYSISLAFHKNDYSTRGTVGVEVVSVENKIVAHSIMLVSLVADEVPAKFFLEPPLTPGKYQLRVFGKRLSRPLYVYELYKYGVLKKIKKPFCSQELI
jgi:hypothetical protein